MPDDVVLAESYGSVLADAAVPCVIVQLHGFANRAAFTHLMETGLAYYEARATPERPWGWIGDVRRMGAIPQAVQEWLIADWNVRAFQAGVREVSIVVAENVLGQLATQQYVRNTTARRDQYEIVTANYPSLEAAKQGARAAFLL
ncbi:MAG TPA: hypothetical protein VF629_03835 [Hymenobacter sp.]|jgi:hypothetical protein|uniref:hypothetical protein n=1 Tax=Hymenobacter sp. TaxID=1898978 RepID=UPI002EDAA703